MNSEDDDISYERRLSIKRFLIGISYIFFLCFIITFLFFTKNHFEGNLEDHSLLNLILTVLGAILLTVFAWIFCINHDDDKKSTFKGIIIATGFGVFTAFSLISLCDSFEISFCFGFISIMCLLTSILIHFLKKYFFIEAIIMMSIGICGSVVIFFILRRYANPTDRYKAIIGLIVSIVSFISFILFIVCLNITEDFEIDNTLDEEDCHYSDEPFIMADIVFVVLSLPITGPTTLAFLILGLYCVIMSENNENN